VTPAEQIAYLRDFACGDMNIFAVCDLAERGLALAEAARECVGQCDHHHGKAAEPDKETYCFTLHERCPCSLDLLADALKPFGETP
jgi:hypothetical protein